MRAIHAYRLAEHPAGVLVAETDKETDAHHLAGSDNLDLALGFILRDENLTPEEREHVLADYFDDIYHVFLKKFIGFYETTALLREEETRLRCLFEELIKVKRVMGQ